MKNWFIVQSHSNFENKVSSLIKEEAEKANVYDKFEEIIVPTHDVTEVKRGKRIQRKKKYFPGYVLVKCEMDNDIYHMIKNLKRVSGFLGSKGKKFSDILPKQRKLTEEKNTLLESYLSTLDLNSFPKKLQDDVSSFRTEMSKIGQIRSKIDSFNISVKDEVAYFLKSS